MRIIGMDIHRVFAEAVALEDGETKRKGVSYEIASGEYLANLGEEEIYRYQ